MNDGIKAFWGIYRISDLTTTVRTNPQAILVHGQMTADFTTMCTSFPFELIIHRVVASLAEAFLVFHLKELRVWFGKVWCYLLKTDGLHRLDPNRAHRSVDSAPATSGFLRVFGARSSQVLQQRQHQPSASRVEVSSEASTEPMPDPQTRHSNATAQDPQEAEASREASLSPPSQEPAENPSLARPCTSAALGGGGRQTRGAFWTLRGSLWRGAASCEGSKLSASPSLAEQRFSRSGTYSVLQEMGLDEHSGGAGGGRD